MPDERWLLIANPISGRGKKRYLVEQVAARLRDAGRSVDLTWTQRQGHAEQLASIAVREGATHVVCCGGDGTAHEVVNGIKRAQAPTGAVTFGLVPLGRCDDLARTLNIPRDPLAAVQTLLAGNVRAIDLGVVNGCYFNTVATMGFDSVVAAYVNDGKTPRVLTGRSAYIYGTLVSLMRYRPIWVRITGDGGDFEGPVFLAATGNAAIYAGGMKIAPPAVVDDGRLDLCLVREVPKLDVLQMLPKVFSGGHTRHPRVSMHTFTRMEIATKEPVTIWADGEPVTKTPAVFQVAPKALGVLAP
ncbi:MAG: diacylglycerol kinase family lipid kinase [Dehalococcoidia bacterium]|nr:diacylglycerol kinase family lipid kinase [Dehalococcoidia bacterium]